MIFKTVWFLIILPVIGLAYLFLRKKYKVSTFRFPSKQLISGVEPSWKIRFLFVPSLIRAVVIVLFCLALAGPRAVLEETSVKTEGIDIVLAIDSSGSMAAEDFKINGKRYNRLDIVKKVVGEFIEAREHDRLGLVTFAGLAYTVSPLTTDNSWLLKNLDRIELGLITDGTAIGSAISTSLLRLRNSDAKSKIIILLTDGISNAGKVDPVSAARIAQSLGVKIYTIGAGTKGRVPFPATDFFGRKVYQSVIIDLDEDVLKEVASVTGGQYFRATDTDSLREVYKEIDKMEKTKIEEVGFFKYDELFDKFLIAALILLSLEIILSNTLFLRIP